jgi:hypothetical protein
MGTNEAEGKRVKADPRCHELLWVECSRPDMAPTSQVRDHWYSRMAGACTDWKRAFYSHRDQ